MRREHGPNDSGGGYRSNWKTDGTQWKYGWYSHEEQEQPMKVWNEEEVKEEHRRDKEERHKFMEAWKRTEGGKGTGSKSANEENEKDDESHTDDHRFPIP